MDQTAAPLEVAMEPERIRRPVRNSQAHFASRLGIVGAVLVVGVLAIATIASITVFSTPDFMSDDITDDPFFGVGLACVFPIIIGVVGLINGIGALGAVRARGGRPIAIRGFVLGIVNIVLPIAVVVVVFQFDQVVSSCGGG
jgi:small-conductance mechanosensitive channel